MYNVIIVDDEAIIREGIQNKIDWAELGLACVGTCENGKQAVELLKTEHIDIVLADIYMPFMNGLELAKHIHNNYPHIKTIILTGCDDFKYAQSAVKLQVFDYLLKPITSAELKEILEKTKTQLDNEHSRQHEINRIAALLKENNPHIKQRFLNQIISGEISPKDVEGKLAFFGIYFKGSKVMAAVLDVDEGYNKQFSPDSADAELLYFAVFNITEELVSDSELGVAFQNNDKQTVILFLGDDSLMDQAASLCERIRRILEEKLMFTITIGIGSVHSGPEQIKTTYSEAIDALNYRFLIGNNRSILITEIKDKLDQKQYSFFEHEKELLLSIKSNKPDLIEKNVCDTINNIKKANLTPARSFYIIQQVLFSLEKSLFELDIDLNELLDGDDNLMVELYKYKTLDEVQIWLIKLCKNVATFLSTERESYCNSLTARAIDFIKDNYSNPDISVNSVCKYLYISVSYFSSVFKNATGETFIEYVTKVRMEKAKDLLRATNLKTYEIARKVGYSDPHYFSSSFKKYTGETPTAFREGGISS